MSVALTDRHLFGGQRIVTAPVVACTLADGPCPPGMQVLHSCDERDCCNPQHLRWGTQGENNREAWSRGRQLRGERHHSARYSDAQVAALRDACASGVKVAEAADELGINRNTAYRIVRGESR